jgi:succinate dehydrogenase / fumarate reductase cytochrome b subunit
MSSAPTPRPAQSRRPKYYDLNLAHLPPPALVSIFHRVSGAFLFFPVLPTLLYLLQATLSSDDAFTRWLELFDRPLVKLVLLGVTWLYAHHFFAGIRYLLLDLHIGIEKAPSRMTSYVVFALGLLATILIGWRLW